MIQKRPLPYLLILPCLILLAGLYGYPILLTMWQSFNKVNFLADTTTFIGLKNYLDVFSDPTFWQTMAITCKYTIITVVLKMVFGFGVGYLLHTELYFKKILGVLVLIPWAIPQVAAGTIWQWILNSNYGYANYFLLKLHLISQPIAFLARPETAFYSVSLVDTWMGIPLLAMLFVAALDAIPKNIYEAAALDGAGAWRQFFAITIPSIKRVLLVVLTLVTIWTFNSFNVIYVLTQGGPMRATETLSIRIYQEAFSRFNLGISSTLTMIAVLILLGLTAVYTLGGKAHAHQAR
ncbi:MAG: sugar ABC transporter permease [Lactobacillus sp.]|jgi:multiple sugar transport system permease protein|nr:sugar ABC transporter permease [Lactobacillus sp.]